MSQPDEQVRARTHLNLVDSSRQLFELDPGARIEAGGGCLFGAGSSSHPAISNAAFRTDDGLDPTLLLQRARAFFGERGRGFSLWVRDGAPDRDLLTAAGAAGLKDVYGMPEMVLPRPVEEPSPKESSCAGSPAPTRPQTTGASPPRPTRAWASRPKSSPSTKITPACSPATSPPSSPTWTKRRLRSQ